MKYLNNNYVLIPYLRHNHILNCENYWITSFNYSGSPVNTNGILSFQSLYLQYFPEMFPSTGLPLIAPFWNDIDTTTFGSIFFRTTSNAALLQRAHDQLQELFPSSGNFTPTMLFIATWDRVAPFGRKTQVRFCIHDNLLLLVYLEWGSACMHVTLYSCCGIAWRGSGIMLHYCTSR